MEKRLILFSWFEDPIEQLAEALKPAVPQNVNLDREKGECILRWWRMTFLLLLVEKASMPG